MEGKTEGEKKTEGEGGKTENILVENAQSTHSEEREKNRLKGGKKRLISARTGTKAPIREL